MDTTRDKRVHQCGFSMFIAICFDTHVHLQVYPYGSSLYGVSVPPRNRSRYGDTVVETLVEISTSMTKMLMTNPKSSQKIIFMTNIFVSSQISGDDPATLPFYNEIMHCHKKHHRRAHGFIIDHSRDSSMMISFKTVTNMA